MIDHLHIARSAYFYSRRRRFSNDAIDRLFRKLRAEARNPSQNLFRIDRHSLRNARWSAICFSSEREPPFLESAAGAIERTFGFLMLVECGSYVALFKSGLDLPSEFRTQYLDKVSSERVEHAIARHDAKFEKLRLRNMSTSKLTLRSKTLEAVDLENAVAASSASRFIPQGYSVRRADGTYTANPSTGRIAVRSDRAGHEELVAWSEEIVALLEADIGEVSPFIRNFARPLQLSSIPRHVKPTYLAIDVIGFVGHVYDADDPVRLIKMVDGAPVELNHAQVTAVVAGLDTPIAISAKRGLLHLLAADGKTEIGTLKIGKTRISLPRLDLTDIEGVIVERRATPLGADPDARPLARYLDRNDLFTVLFTDLTLAYIDGGLFRDDALVGGGAHFLAHLQIAPDLAASTSEKGSFHAGQTAFDTSSVFHTVVNSIATDDVLMCDDLGDEWADFIGVSTASSPMMISFYHAKHGTHSLSASAFHDSVGQAIKNLGRMALPYDMLPGKLASWDNRYRNNGIQTDIARLMRGGSRDDIASKMEKARVAPDVLRRVFIVTSSLSRAQVEQVFQAAASGTAPPPHFVQLYWLLMSYFAAAVEVGVRGYVVCRP